MVLVDTSVIVDFLKNRENSQTKKLDDIISRGIMYGITPFVYQELLQGAATEKEFGILKDYLSTQKFYDVMNGLESFEAAARLFFKCRKSGITVRSTIDFLLVQTALEHGLLLLHNDSDFSNISKIVKELKMF
jgi:predicted nucleic acid-binding protein